MTMRLKMQWIRETIPLFDPATKAWVLLDKERLFTIKGLDSGKVMLN